MRFWRVFRGARAADVCFCARLTERVNAPTALIRRRPVIMTAANDDLLVLTVLLYQALIQLHPLILQFGSCILLNFPLALLVLFLRIAIFEIPGEHFIALQLVASRILFVALGNDMLVLFIHYAFFVSLIPFPFVLRTLFVVFSVLPRFFLCAECVVGASFDLLINILEHTVDYFLGWR